ncbi:hypothetical protein BDV95DRAFT_162451 [Massariosphaeria phaeospora]|uniref:Uncharacterized protein n=1 Tax=Massariosphaeria phaeospora TaxID=100035 RepID=A0A7C8I5K2_9PLEO|nr:hypothetical protein BDV95DRAFT_162451 [Massariosphaeria phaeospora]
MLPALRSTPQGDVDYLLASAELPAHGPPASSACSNTGLHRTNLTLTLAPSLPPQALTLLRPLTTSLVPRPLSLAVSCCPPCRAEAMPPRPNCPGRCLPVCDSALGPRRATTFAAASAII